MGASGPSEIAMRTTSLSGEVAAPGPGIVASAPPRRPRSARARRPARWRAVVREPQERIAVRRFPWALVASNLLLGHLATLAVDPWWAGLLLASPVLGLLD